MPHDRFDVARMLLATVFLVAFTLVGLLERLRNDHRHHLMVRSTVECSTAVPVTFEARWP